MFRTHVILMLLFIVVLISHVVDAHAFQEHQLFDYTTLESESIQERHKVEEALSRARSAPTTKEIYLIRFNVDLLDSLNDRVDKSSGEERMSFETKETPVYFYTPSEERIEFDQIYITRETSSDYFVHGSHTQGLLADVFAEFYLSVFSGLVLGNIDVGSESYFVSSFGESLHGLRLLDKSKFKNEGPHHCVDCGE
ncbi:MAG: hypothetical protein OXI81_00375 [Paracoccaceae bacterium]|nr:hypothetical protein [Paracoccaceae bacterium]